VPLFSSNTVATSAAAAMPQNNRAVALRRSTPARIGILGTVNRQGRYNKTVAEEFLPVHKLARRSALGKLKFERAQVSFGICKQKYCQQTNSGEIEFT